MKEIIHQFELGVEMFKNIPICSPRNANKYVGQWTSDGVTCKTCIKMNKHAVRRGKEDHSFMWRTKAYHGFDECLRSATAAKICLDRKDDYGAQIQGHASLRALAEALGDLAASVERRPK